MYRINMQVTWNPMTWNWLVRSGNLTFFTSDLTVKKSGDSLIIYRTEGENGYPIFSVREVPHISLYVDEPGFRRVFGEVAFINDTVEVDGRHYDGKR